MLAAMRMLALVLLFAAASLRAQTPAVSPAPAPDVWDPVKDYITIGQDEPGYRNWYVATPAHATSVKAFNDYLVQYGVGGVFPTWQLLRTATSWQRCGGQPFEVPPTSEWPHIVQTLRYVRDYVIPAVGPVEPVSGYRNPHLNVCAGGAPESAHKHYSAIDMVPLRPTNRPELMSKLCNTHAARGLEYHAGLGFYAFLRFHVDSTRFRRWGVDAMPDSPPCPAIVSELPPTQVAARDVPDWSTQETQAQAPAPQETASPTD